MNTLAIFGVGLIGGSFAMAMRQAGFAGKIVGVGSPATLDRAQQLQVIDTGASAQSAAEQADLVYLALPIRAILKLLPELNGWVRPGALITDAGSTKREIVAAATKSLMRTQFLGGHPLAGKESRGLSAAEPNLFEGRAYIVTPRTQADLETPAARDLLVWLELIGCRTLVLDAARHDEIVAYTSHLPQLASTALAMLLADTQFVASGVFGPALLGATRLALSPFEIWEDILSTNRSAVSGALDAYIGHLTALRNSLDSPEMAVHFATAATAARAIRSL